MSVLNVWSVCCYLAVYEPYCNISLCDEHHRVTCVNTVGFSLECQIKGELVLDAHSTVYIYSRPHSQT